MHQPLPPINLDSTVPMTTSPLTGVGVIRVFALGHLVTATTTTTSDRPWAFSINRLASPASMELEVTVRKCASVIRNDNDIRRNSDL